MKNFLDFVFGQCAGILHGGLIPFCIPDGKQFWILGPMRVKKCDRYQARKIMHYAALPLMTSEIAFPVEFREHEYSLAWQSESNLP
jgi:hypothetical protein